MSKKKNLQTCISKSNDTLGNPNNMKVFELPTLCQSGIISCDWRVLRLDTGKKVQNLDLNEIEILINAIKNFTQNK